MDPQPALPVSQSQAAAGPLGLAGDSNVPGPDPGEDMDPHGHQTLSGPKSPTQSSLYSHRALGKAKEMSKKAIFEAILSASGLYCNAAQVPKYTMLGGM